MMDDNGSSSAVDHAVRYRACAAIRDHSWQGAYQDECHCWQSFSPPNWMPFTCYFSLLRARLPARSAQTPTRTPYECYTSILERDLSILAPPSASAQQVAEHVLPLRAPPRHPLGQQRAPIVPHGDDRPVPLVLHQNVHELPARHVLRHLREDERRPVRPLEVEPHPRPLRPVLLVDVLGVLHEVPPSLAVSPVIPPVRLEPVPEPSPHLLAPSDLGRGAVEHRVGAHLGREELLPDVVRADGREGERPSPEEEAGARHDLLAGGERELLGGGRVSGGAVGPPSLGRGFFSAGGGASAAAGHRPRRGRVSRRRRRTTPRERGARFEERGRPRPAGR
mmetsp:Transcript_35162/g.75016  ORF Transcript_35162/g.75016 Transcript_35162/m.75016 type:complete len:336 (-) Transcript_35162:260-1267(-)